MAELYDLFPESYLLTWTILEAQFKFPRFFEREGLNQQIPLLLLGGLESSCKSTFLAPLANVCVCVLCFSSTKSTSRFDDIQG